MLKDFFTTKNIVFLLMAGIVIFFLVKASDIALMLFASFVISCVLIPVIDKMSKKIPRALATTIMLLAIFLGTILVFIPLAVFALKQFYLMFNNLPEYIENIKNFLSFNIWGFSPASLIHPDMISDFVNKTSSVLLEKTLEFTKILATSTTSLIAITLITFYICTDWENLEKQFIKFFPKDLKDKAKEILSTIMTKVGGYVFAQLITMVFVGVVTALGLALVGHPHALTLGFITFACDIIPAIGPAIAIGLTLATAASGGIGYIILVLLVCMIAQVVQNQAVRPFVLGKFMNMHPLMIILSLLIGAKFLGLWGVILAPAIASVFIVLIDELYIKTINKEEK